MTIKKIGSLEIESEAQRVNHTFLMIQKVFIVLMVVILLASLLGMLGTGWFSFTSSTQGNFRVSYEKFIHAKAKTFYHVKINTPSSDKTIKIWFDPSFFKNIMLENIMPSPTEQEIVNNQILFVFNIHKSESINITFTVEAQHPGKISSTIGLGTGEKIQLNQFIYP